MNYVLSFNQKVITYSERLLNMLQGRAGLMVFRRISISTNSFFTGYREAISCELYYKNLTQNLEKIISMLNYL